MDIPTVFFCVISFLLVLFVAHWLYTNKFKENTIDTKIETDEKSSQCSAEEFVCTEVCHGITIPMDNLSFQRFVIESFAEERWMKVQLFNLIHSSEEKGHQREEGTLPSMRNAIKERFEKVRDYLGHPAAENFMKRLEPLNGEMLLYSSDENEMSRNKQLEREMVENVIEQIKNILDKIKNIEDEEKKREELNSKDYFTYLLLDSGKINGIDKWQKLDPKEKWKTFVRSIFYVGKGKNLRPYDHLTGAYEILTADKNVEEKVDEMHEKSKKNKQGQNIQNFLHILKIWSKGDGVIILKAFGFIKPYEAFTREAVIIDTLGKPSLHNKIGGSYHDGGVLKKLEPVKKSSFGKYLLLQMMSELTTDKIPITPYML